MITKEMIERWIERGCASYNPETRRRDYTEGAKSLLPLVLDLLSALEIATELLHVPEHAQDDEWYERCDRVNEALAKAEAFFGVKYE